MKKLFFLLLFLPISLIAQENESRVNVGFSIAPEICSLILQPAGEQNHSKIGFSSSFFLDYKINSKFTFQTGVGFGYRNYGHLKPNLIFTSDIDPQIGIISFSRLTTTIKMVEFQIPLLIKHHLKNPHFYFKYGLNLGFQTGINNSRNILYGNGNTEELNDSNDNTFNIATTVGFGFTKPISDKINLSIEPMLNLYMRDYVIPLGKLYTTGVNVSLIKKL